jgi:hypothetical protein
MELLHAIKHFCTSKASKLITSKASKVSTSAYGGAARHQALFTQKHTDSFLALLVQKYKY